MVQLKHIGHLNFFFLKIKRKKVLWICQNSYFQCRLPVSICQQWGWYVMGLLRIHFTIFRKRYLYIAAALLILIKLCPDTILVTVLDCVIIVIDNYSNKLFVGYMFVQKYLCFIWVGYFYFGKRLLHYIPKHKIILYSTSFVDWRTAEIGSVQFTNELFIGIFK